MQAELERHGGVFEGNMLYDHTDYLIVRNIYSEKYRIALEWGTIILVNEYWFQDSVRCNSTLLPSFAFTQSELQNPIHYQNFTQTIEKAQDKAATQSNPHVRLQLDKQTPTSFTDSCLSLVQPLESGRTNGLAAHPQSI